MPSTPAEFRRIIRALIHHEQTRTGISAVVLVALYATGYRFAAAFVLAALTYIGLWLLSGPSEAAGSKPPNPTYRDVLEAFEACRELSGRIKAHLETISSSRIFDRISGVSLSATQVIEAMSEDQKLEASLALRDPLTRADEILTRYARLVRRGWDTDEVQDRVLADLSTIDQLLGRLLIELNRQAVLDLEALSATMQRDLGKIAVEIPSLPPRLPPDFGSSLPPDARKLIESLTARELEVLRQLPTGRTDQEIADALFISKRTVSDHVTNLCAKLGVRNRTEAAAFAARNGLTPAEPA